jgi:lipid-A-disaccharide synthase
VEPEDRYPAMRQSRVLLAASGTVTLEAALIGTPGLLAYKLSPFEFKLTNWLVNVEFAGLPNLIHDREVFPELIQDKAEPEGMARTALELMQDGPRRQAVLNDLAALRNMVGEPGAPGRAATIILKDMQTKAEVPHA